MPDFDQNPRRDTQDTTPDTFRLRRQEVLSWPKIDREQAQDDLLSQLLKRRDDIEQFLTTFTERGSDLVYRFHHQSFKVYGLQSVNREAVDFLETFLNPEHGRGFGFYLRELIEAGAGEVKFDESHNREWSKHTRPFVDCYLHLKHLLESMRDAPPVQRDKDYLSTEFATVLECFHLR